MAYPIPTVEQLATFAGRPVESFTAFATEALIQATVLFSLLTEVTEPLGQPDLDTLATNAILQMADDIYLKQPYVPIQAKPFSSETIGSYSYSMSSGGGSRTNAAAIFAQSDKKTGLVWWDLALMKFGRRDVGFAYGSVEVFDTPMALERDENGILHFLGPSQTNQVQVPFDFNVPTTHDPK